MNDEILDLTSCSPFIHYQRVGTKNVVLLGKRFRNFAPRRRCQKDVVPESILKARKYRV